MTDDEELAALTQGFFDRCSDDARKAGVGAFVVVVIKNDGETSFVNHGGCLPAEVVADALALAALQLNPMAAVVLGGGPGTVQ